MDGLTNQRTDGQMDRPTYRDAWSHLKMDEDIDFLRDSEKNWFSFFAWDAVGQMRLCLTT